LLVAAGFLLLKPLESAAMICGEDLIFSVCDYEKYFVGFISSMAYALLNYVQV